MRRPQLEFTGRKGPGAQEWLVGISAESSYIRKLGMENGVPVYDAGDGMLSDRGR